MDVGIILLVVFFAALAYLMLRPREGPARVCTVCEHHGPAEQHTPGSTGVELLLYLLLIVPGLIYSVWRLSARKLVCASCGAAAIVPPDSPAGKRLIAQGERSTP